MNSYEEKQEAKRERLKAAAAKRRAAAEKLSKDGWDALSQIPFGQPILVGHHSERSDRAYRGRAVGKIDKSVELSKQADNLEARADGVGSGGISSDDPEAVRKLEDKLLKLEEAHAHMVESNREARANGQEKPYATYQLTNSGANVRRIKERIAGLEQARGAETMQPKSGNGWTMHEDKSDNRIVIKFNSRPSSEICKSLRSYGFLWSPSRGAWVRNAVNARFAIDRAYQILATL
jgi:hypothetical protein